MNAISCCENIKNQWHGLNEVKKTSYKYVGLAIITAIAFTAIALSLHFTMHHQPIPGWSVDELLLVTALPGGVVSTTVWLTLAYLHPKWKQQQQEVIEKEINDPNSQFNENLRKWSKELHETTSTALRGHRKLMEQDGTDLISILRQLKAGTLKGYSKKDMKILLSAPLLHPLTPEERQLCIEFGIDPEKCWILDAV